MYLLEATVLHYGFVQVLLLDKGKKRPIAVFFLNFRQVQVLFVILRYNNARNVLLVVPNISLRLCCVTKTDH